MKLFFSASCDLTTYQQMGVSLNGLKQRNGLLKTISSWLMTFWNRVQSSNRLCSSYWLRRLPRKCTMINKKLFFTLFYRMCTASSTHICQCVQRNLSGVVLVQSWATGTITWWWLGQRRTVSNIFSFLNSFSAVAQET